jgi:hypothetical protein
MAWVVAYFEQGGSPATGLSPLLRIRYAHNGTIVAEDTMEEFGNGFYRFDFVTYDMTKDYTMLADGVTLPNRDRFLEGATGEYGDISSNIYIMSDNIDCRVLLMKKIFENKLELENGKQDNWVLYDDDGVTPLLTYDASDVNGDDVYQITGMTSKRSKAKEG